jgi:uncharacterized protein YkwD
MKRLLTLLSTCILVGGLLCACVGPPPSQPTSPPKSTSDEIAEEIIVRINAEREALGLEPFVVNEHLMLMARWRSQDMVDGDYFSHDPALGHPTLADFCGQLGYDSLHAPMENLVYIELADGQSLDGIANATVESWRDSPSHWRLIASPDIEMTGVGVVVGNDRVIVTQLFWTGGISTPVTARQYNRPAP